MKKKPKPRSRKKGAPPGTLAKIRKTMGKTHLYDIAVSTGPQYLYPDNGR